MGFIFLGLAGLLSIVSLVCLILVIVKMFQNDDSTLGIICILTTIFCGFGGLITFVMGWVNAGKYGASQLMLVWTGCIVGSMILGIIGQVLMGDQLVAQ
ncbi:hypothetical protein ACYFX5_23715 [Bremerella sp. T1]|uniref:hypothetical protein n=1 Tax=Bremerella sp. TYQ1 TaxID=3119568 RepID=UPI001CCAEBB7|nr:hypothetical protein [Bremerella volcania]UBM36038.1 hypothetical protein LA756_25660 [Bremerella volcania]